tara:strand:+ start:874 stop:1221 length:348 start_codon:yes stop_codon:yes gene_type:complete
MKEEVLIEGHIGQLDEHIENIQSLLPNLDVIGFSSKSMAGIGKSMTLLIKDTSIEEAKILEEYLLNNEISFVGEFGSHKFFKCKNQDDWTYLTGDYEEMPISHISIEDISKIYSF